MKTTDTTPRHLAPGDVIILGGQEHRVTEYPYAPHWGRGVHLLVETEDGQLDLHPFETIRILKEDS